jgi:glyoxylase-like metal-dependent hydrolase (beta-lactamase superfamily II)
MTPIEVRQTSVGPFDNNVYVLVDPESGHGVLIDTPTDPEAIRRLIGPITIDLIVLTHGDQDHIQALDEMRTSLGVDVAMHEADAASISPPPDRMLADGDTVPVGSASLAVAHTPGHTPGSICLVGDGFVIAGDTLFPGGPGNTKRPDGNFEAIIDGISRKLFVLPDESVVYPGHGKSTTIGAERPHLDEWVRRGW